MAGASDRYEHYFHSYTDAQYDNLLTLARYLIVNARKIEVEGGLLFDPAYMLDFTPMPDGIVVLTAGELSTMLEQANVELPDDIHLPF